MIIINKKPKDDNNNSKKTWSENKSQIIKDLKKHSRFTIIAYLFLIFSIIMLVFYIMLADLTFILTFVASSVITISCLFGLGNARERLAKSEAKVKDCQEELMSIKKSLDYIRQDLNNKQDKGEV